jgi:hypothetical protein
VGTAVLVGAALVGGCSSPPENRRPEIPGRVCWDAFTGSDVEPFLRDGEKARSQTRLPFELYGWKSSVTCVVYVDGNNQFMATAARQAGDVDLDWSTWERAGGTPLDVGEQGLIWNSGTVTYFFCGKPDSRDKIELRLDGSIRDDIPKARRLLTELTKKYLAFAQKELDCSAPGTTPRPTTPPAHPS